MHRQYVTREYLIEVLTPLIGQKLDRENLGKRRLSVNISRPGQTRVDADIRRITDEGIGDYFYGRVEILRWEDIREVQFVLRDHLDNIEYEGERLALEHAPMQAAA